MMKELIQMKHIVSHVPHYQFLQHRDKEGKVERYVSVETWCNAAG